jgi:hypothetical protein
MTAHDLVPTRVLKGRAVRVVLQVSTPIQGQGSMGGRFARSSSLRIPSCSQLNAVAEANVQGICTDTCVIRMDSPLSLRN